MSAVPESLDESRVEAFEERLVDALNGGAVCLMASIGHRTGLFDTMASMAPADSAGIARRAGLEERYVREWLGAMTTAGVVEHDADRGTYHLPAEHAARLTREADENIAVFMQYIGMLGGVEDDVTECFRKGGGVPYARYPRFHEIMSEDSGLSVLPALIDDILPLVPDLIDRLESGIDVLDLGCGRGKALKMMAEHFPNSRFLGYDLSQEAVGFARNEAARAGLDNVRYEVRDLSDFDETAEPASFDLVTTFDAVHDQKAPLRLLRGIRRTLRPDGIYLAQDIKGSSHHHLDVDHPIGPTLYTLSCMHCMTVSLADDGEGLGAMWGREKAERYFREAGFDKIDVHELDHDIQNYYYVCRPTAGGVE